MFESLEIESIVWNKRLRNIFKKILKEEKEENSQPEEIIVPLQEKYQEKNKKRLNELKKDPGAFSEFMHVTAYEQVWRLFEQSRGITQE